MAKIPASQFNFLFVLSKGFSDSIVIALRRGDIIRLTLCSA